MGLYHACDHGCRGMGVLGTAVFLVVLFALLAGWPLLILSPMWWPQFQAWRRRRKGK